MDSHEGQVLPDDHREGKKVEGKKFEGKAGDARSKIRGGHGGRDASVEAPLTIQQSCCDEMFSLMVQPQGDFNSTFVSGRC